MKRSINFKSPVPPPSSSSLLSLSSSFLLFTLYLVQFQIVDVPMTWAVYCNVVCTVFKRKRNKNGPKL